MAPSRREYGLVLLVGAVGAVLVLLAVRERWAEAVFTPPKPLASTVISVSGTDLVPAAEGLAIAALACLAAVIATRGVLRRAAGVLLTAFGLGTGIAVSTAVTSASVLSAATSSAGSPATAAYSGAAGSTTGGRSAGSGGITILSSAGHAIMTGTPWRAAVLIGALLIVAAGVAAVWRGPRWPVMSARYDPPERRPAAGASGGTGGGAASADAATADAATADTVGANAAVEDAAGAPARQRDSASMWESLSTGADPTDGS